MNEIFQANGEVIAARWPGLWARLQAEDASALAVELVEGQGSTLSLDGVQLTSRHDRVAEARLQAATLAADAPLLHLYGTGLGDLQGVLLERTELQQLAVYILNSALFALVLGVLDQRAWLRDPRVTLSQAGEQREIALPFFALPAETVLADDFNARIRDRLVSETHLAFNNREFDVERPELVQGLLAAEPLLQADPDVAQLFATQAGQEVYVIATGPTLEQHFAELQRLRQRSPRPLMICVDTAFRPLLAQDILPDIVVTIDARINELHLPAERSSGITLVYLPLVRADLLQGWRGPRYAAYSFSPVYDRLRTRLPKASLYTGGSVIHPAVDLAVQMGAARVVLFGADFAIPGRKTHAGWSGGALGPQAWEAKYWVHDGHGQRVKTQLNFRGYLMELERYIARHPHVQFLNTSRDGAMIAGTGFAAEFVQ